jgi:1-acyl-sn-glycerol-3-phosphate acyltransferase
LSLFRRISYNLDVPENRDKTMPWYYHVSFTLIKVALHLFTRWQITGQENVFAAGSVLVVSNHLSNIDPPLVGVSLGRQTMFMAKDELFRNPLGAAFMRGLGAFPVDRRHFTRKTLQQAEAILAQDMQLTMFPEQHRSHDARMHRGFHGTALIACRNDVPILPVGITGTERITGFLWIFRRPRVTVNIGQTFRLPKSTNLPDKEELDRHTETIMRRIAALLPAEYRGEYGDSKT